MRPEKASNKCSLAGGRVVIGPGLNIRCLLLTSLAAIVGLSRAHSAQAQQITPPGYYLVYRAAVGVGPDIPPDGNLSNPDEWFEPVTGTPYENVPGSGDDATVASPGLSSAYGSLNCWGAGLTALEVPLNVTASISIGVGGLALSGDPYTPSALTLSTSATTSGPFLALENLYLDASVTAAGPMTSSGNVNVNASVTANGVDASYGALNVNGSISAGAFSGTFPVSDFYSTTTALQVDDAATVSISGGTVNCNADAVIGADGDNTDANGNPTFAVIGLSSGATLTTSGVTYMGVINPNEPNVSSQEPGYGVIIITGAGSTWKANGDIRVGDSNNGLGSISVQDGGTLELGAGVNLRLGSSDGGEGTLTFDGTSGSPTLTSDPTSSIIVGDQASGELTVQNGAAITHGGTIDVGNAQGSDGTVSITGENSSLTCTGGLTMGDGGTGTANIVTNASLTASGNLILGSMTTGNGTMNVGQAAMSSNTASSGTVTVNKTLTVGESGTGDLEVVGGTLTVNGSGADVVIGDGSTGVGTVDIDGSGASVLANGVIVGNNGQGTLTVKDGALAVNGDLVISAQSGSNGSLTVEGADAVLDIGGNLTVGANGPATFMVSGATVNLGVGGGSQPVLTAADEDAPPIVLTTDTFDHSPNVQFSGATINGNGASWTVGSNTSNNMLTVSARTEVYQLNEITVSGGQGASNNTLVVTGNGTSFEVNYIVIAASGTGFLNVTAGANVELGVAGSGSGIGVLTLGDGTGTGNALVSTNGSIKSTDPLSTIDIGLLSPGAMVISSNGYVDVPQVHVGSGSGGGSLTVSGTGAAKSATLSAFTLDVGEGGPGQMLISSGGFVLPTSVVFGNYGGSGTGDVSGAGSALNGISLSVGNAGSGKLTIESAATATFSGTSVGGANGANLLSVTGPGSSFTSGTLSIGGGDTTGKVAVSSNGSVMVGTKLENLVGGTIDLSGGGSMTVGGSTPTLVAGQLTLNANGTVINYGSITCNTFVNQGGALVQLGQLVQGSLTDDGITSLGPGTVFGSNLALIHTSNNSADDAEPGAPISITGDLTVGDDGVLDMLIDGSGDGEYPHLTVDGTTSLAGTVLLDFQNGFAPAAGDIYDLFTFEGGVNSFANQIQVAGLEPGWQYALEQQNGDEVIESLSNGVAVPEPSMWILPLMLCGAMGLWRPQRDRHAWPEQHRLDPPPQTRLKPPAIFVVFKSAAPGP